MTRFITSEAFNNAEDLTAAAAAADVAAAGAAEPTADQITSSTKLIEMMKDAAERSSKTRMVAVMDAAIAADNLDFAYLAVQEINKRGFQQDPVTLNRLVAASCNAGEVDRAYQLVDSFSNFGVLSDSESMALLVKGYVAAGQPFKAFHVLECWDNLVDATTPEPDMLKSLHAALGDAPEAATVAARM